MVMSYSALAKFQCLIIRIAEDIIPLCKHVVAKVTLVLCSVYLTGKREKVGPGEVTTDNARIIVFTTRQIAA